MIDLDLQVFSHAEIEDAERPNSPTAGERVADEVHRPALVRPRHDRSHRWPRSPTDALARSTAHGKALLTVEPVDALEVDSEARSSQQRVESSIAEADPLVGELPQLPPQRRIIHASGLIAVPGPLDAEEPAGPASAQAVTFATDIDRLTTLRGP